MRALDVLQQLLAAGGKATASGLTRPPQPSMNRKARIRVGEVEGEIQIRSMSANGAMIDGIDVGDDTIGIEILIELLEDQMFPARLKWAADGKAGIEFAEHFNMEWLKPQLTKEDAVKEVLPGARRGGWRLGYELWQKFFVRRGRDKQGARATLLPRVPP